MDSKINQLRTNHDLDLALNNQHPLQTKEKFYQNIPKDNWVYIRKIGEIWVDDEGKKWKKVGEKSRVRVSKLDTIRKEIQKFENCPKEKCTSEFNPSRLDLKFKHLNGMCRLCTAKHETKLKIEGKYEEYEKNKIKQNVLSFIKEKYTEKEDYINELANMSKIVQQNGRIEKWHNIDRQKAVDRVEGDFEKLIEILSTNYELSEEEINEATS